MADQSAREAVAWRLRDVAWAGVLAFVLFGGAAIAAALLGGESASLASRHVRAGIVATSELAFVGAAWAFSVRRPGTRWRDLGLRGFRPLAGCMGALFAFCLAFAVNLAWGLILQLLGWPGQPPLLPLFGQGALGLTLALVGTGVIAPFSEEVFFRGFAFPALRARFGLLAGIAVDAALFSLLHFTPTVLPPIFVMGVLFCLLYQHTRSIWPGALLHAAINIVAVLVAYALG